MCEEENRERKPKMEVQLATHSKNRKRGDPDEQKGRNQKRPRKLVNVDKKDVEQGSKAKCFFYMKLDTLRRIAANSRSGSKRMGWCPT